MKWKRLFLLALVLVVCANALSVPVLAEAAQEPVTLRFSWWGAESRHKVTLDAMNLYMERNPHVKIEAEYSDWDGYYQKLLTQLAGGTAPDLITTLDRWLADLSRQGDFLLDVNSVSDTVDLSGFDPTFLRNDCTVDDVLMGLPFGLVGTIFMYNTEFFDRYGIAPDTVWTWENLIDYGQAVQQQNPEAYLLSTETDEMCYILRTYVRQITGEPFIKDDYTIGADRETLLSMFTLLKDYVDAGVCEPFEQAVLFMGRSHENPKFQSGDLGMQFKMNSHIPKYRGVAAFPLDVTLMPIADGAVDTGFYMGSSMMLSINAASPNVDEAAKFMNFWFNDEECIRIVGTDRGVQPTENGRKVLVDAGKADDVQDRAIEMSIANASKISDLNLTYNSELTKIFMDCIDKIAYGVDTPEHVTDEFISLTNRKLEELKQGY